MLYVNKKPVLINIIIILADQLEIYHNYIKKSFVLQPFTFIFNYKYNIRIISGIIAYLTSEQFLSFINTLTFKELL